MRSEGWLHCRAAPLVYDLTHAALFGISKSSLAHLKFESPVQVAELGALEVQGMREEGSLAW